MDKCTFTDKVLAAERTLYRVAKTMLMSDKDCEDAVQNAVLKAYEKLETLKNEGFFKTWLVRILINECKNVKRSRFFAVFDEETFETGHTECPDYADLYQAIRELKPRIRIVIVLHYLEGYSVEEIKGILSIPSGTVKSRLSKGRAVLKAKLEPRRLLHES